MMHSLRGDPDDGYVARTHISVAGGKRTAAGAPGAMRIEEQAVYGTDGELVRATQRLFSNAGTTVWRLEKAEGSSGWVYTVETGGVAQSKRVAQVKDNLDVTLEIYRGVRSGTIRSGERWSDTVFSLNLGRAMYVETRCLATPKESPSGTWVFENRDNVMNQAERWEMDSLGRTVLQEMPPVFVARRAEGSAGESGEPEIGLAELMDLFRIPADRVPGPDDTVRLILSEPATLHTSVRHYYHGEGGAYRLLYPPNRCLAGKDGEESPSKWLEATPTMQTEDRRIRAIAAKLAKKSGSRCELVRRSTDYVYRKLEKRNVATFSSALETLEAGYGDCGEHAVLLAALLRAADVPARVMLGLVYIAGRNGWLYHAWVVAYPGSQPLFADPAMGRFPATTGLIPLVIDDTGENAALLGALLGRVSLRYGEVE
jgi:hypothetical protein